MQKYIQDEGALENIPDRAAFQNQKDNPVYVAVASFDQREQQLVLCVDSLLHQVDHIFIYLNNYEHIPEPLLGNDKITVNRSQDYRDLSATGKVYPLDTITDCYFFTIDDDFAYPANYIATMCKTIEKYNRKCAVTVHGSIFPDDFDWYYERTAMFQYQGGIKNDVFVHLPGTGSFGFHTDTLKASFTHFVPNVMVDLTFAILCKLQRVPMVTVKRPQFWMCNTEREGLYQQFLVDKTHHTKYALKYAPWTFADYASYAIPILEEIFGELSYEKCIKHDLDHSFVKSHLAGTRPRTWARNSIQVERRLEAEGRSIHQ